MRGSLDILDIKKVVIESKNKMLCFEIGKNLLLANFLKLISLRESCRRHILSHCFIHDQLTYPAMEDQELSNEDLKNLARFLRHLHTCVSFFMRRKNPNTEFAAMNLSISTSLIQRPEHMGTVPFVLVVQGSGTSYH